MDSNYNKSKLVIHAGLQQVLLGITNFSVTWVALRALDYEKFSLYALFWAFAWGGLAVISEFLISPNRADAIKKENYSSLISICAIAGTLSLSMLFVGMFLHPSVKIVIFGASLMFAAVAFHALRAYLASENRLRNILLCPMLVVFNSSTLLTLNFTNSLINPEILLLVTSISHLVPLLLLFPYRFSFRWLFSEAIHAFRYALKHGSGFGLSTLIRVASYSVIFMMLVQFKEGKLGLAVFASAAALISPSQIFTAALSWALFPSMVQSASRGNTREMIVSQLWIYATTGCVLCIGLGIVWPWWLSFTIGDVLVQRIVSDEAIFVLLLLFFAVLSAFPSSVFHALKAQRHQLWVSLFSGLLGFCLLLLGTNSVLTSAITYASYTVIAVLVAFRLASSEGSTREKYVSG
jgi:O-antigen/teichoic acid export membrane protein